MALPTGGHVIKRFSHLLQSYFGGDECDESVRRKLVHTLYTQPTSLAIGALAGAVCATVAIHLTGDPFITVVGLALILVGLLRVTLGYWLVREPDRYSAKTLEVTYEVGAFAYALLSGLTAAAAMLWERSDHLIALMITYATAYAVGITARNAGRPVISLGQMSLTFLPIIVTGLIVGTLPLLVLSGLLLFVFVAMSSITFHVFSTLKEQFLAAENSARMAEKMRELARTDVVTGLTNRAGLNHELVEHLMSLPSENKLALFWLDLDRFKEVNDMLGHPVGDQVLAEVAQRLRGAAPERATVSRFGGDEFVIACEVKDRGECERMAQGFAAALGEQYRVEGHRIHAGASMGVALLPDDGSDIDTLMQSADLALYHAKVAGRDRIRFFDGAMTRELVRKKEIEKELRAAIQKDELSIFFQPIVDLKTGRIRTFEALVRWFHPEKGELRPDEFIPVAEETGVIITLGNWITAQAAKACAQWPDDVTVAVNLSPLQIRAPGAALGIMAAVREAGLDPHRLELEVTESLFLDDDENTARFMEELAAEGVRFALDDFGTGYSSLGYINQFPFSKIKVDRSFVSGPNVGKKSDAIIRAVAEMGSTLEMSIVAEGLETVEQVAVVSEAGCTLGQGYYFSRAVPDFLAAMLLAQDRGRDGETRAAG